MTTAGEGPHPILFGQVSVTARTRLHPAYLARPDVRGSFPTVVVVPTAWGTTSSVKDLSRRMARHGLAVVVPDLYRGAQPPRGASRDDAEAAMAGIPDTRARQDLTAVYRYLAAPGTEWSDPDRIGLLGMGWGGRLAVASAAAAGHVRAVALVHAPLGGDRTPTVLDLLGRLRVPLLGLCGKADDEVPLGDIEEARARHRRSEWVLYQDIGPDFLDDGRDGFDVAAATDAMARLVAFFASELASVEVGETA